MSEHWYDRNGGSQYDADLRKARKAGYVPSVTTVMSVVDKPALTTWLIEQHIMAALTMPRLPDESESAYIARIKIDGRAQAKAAAEEGTRIHQAIEESFTKKGFDSIYLLHVDGALKELYKIFPGVNDWVSEKSFAHPLGFGGKVDLHSPSAGIVVDFKTKDGDFSDGKRLHYDQNIQLAAYQVGLDLARWDMNVMRELTSRDQELTPFQRCANIFVSRTHPGAVASHVWSADDIACGWGIFEAALTLWKRVKKFDSAY